MSKLADDLSEWFAGAPDSVKTALADSIQEEADASGQVTKAEANYRPSEGAECCDGCGHFDGTSACDVVAGKINPNYVSDKYEGSGGKSEKKPVESSGGKKKDDAGAKPAAAGGDRASPGPGSDAEPDSGDPAESTKQDSDSA